MPEVEYETTVTLPRPITVSTQPLFPSEAAAEIHEFVVEQNVALEILAEESTTNVSAW